MRCLTPITIKNPHAHRMGASQYMEVPCRKCSICMKRRATQWMFRLQWEDKYSDTSAFMTYTYADETVPISPNGLLTLDKKHHTDFMKRLRKHVKKNYPNNPPLKYYMVGEYGGETERPHYHAILFNLPKYMIDRPETIMEIWQHGLITADTVSNGSIAYVVGYVNKQKFFTTDDPNDDRVKEFSLMSKKLGIQFLTEERKKRMRKLLEPTIKVEDGRIMAIPDYFRKKVFNEEELFIIAQKTQDWLSENPDWKSEQHHIDYVKIDAHNRLKKSKQRRKI